MPHGEIIFEEISEQLQKGKGCIIFNFGLYFPYKLNEGDKLIYKFQLGLNAINDVKLNHRYPNKLYYTITKTYGRKLSKCGYPYYFDLEEGKPFFALLNLTTGVVIDGQEDSFSMIFPLEAQLTAENPVCGLSLRQNFEDGTIEFISHKYDKENRGWIPRYWTNKLRDAADAGNQYFTLFDMPEFLDDKCVIFDTVITPFADDPHNLLVM